MIYNTEILNNYTVQKVNQVLKQLKHTRKRNNQRKDHKFQEIYQEICIQQMMSVHIFKYSSIIIINLEFNNRMHSFKKILSSEIYSKDQEQLMKEKKDIKYKFQIYRKIQEIKTLQQKIKKLHQPQKLPQFSNYQQQSIDKQDLDQDNYLIFIVRLAKYQIYLTLTLLTSNLMFRAWQIVEQSE